MSIKERLKNAKPINSKKLNKSLKIYNENMKYASIVIQKQNRESEHSASQARLTT